MNIKDVYWKCRRIFRKHKDTMSRVISYALIALLVVAVVYAAYSIHKSDLRREEIANQEKDKTTIKATTKYDYGTPGFNKVSENDKLILEADFTTGEICVTEKASGMKWYSNPQDRAEDTNAKNASRLNCQMHVEFINLDKGIKIDYDNYAGSIKKGRMEHELIENGVKFTFGFPVANVYIPVQYTLTEDGFQAEIVTSEIKGVGSNPFLVVSASLLPYFGAGDLEDEGYLFVPDGSGALIDFNNNKQTNQEYYSLVYGDNPALTKTSQTTVQQKATLPVFGAKVNDHAFFGVVVSGEQCAGIAAATSLMDSSYNHVYTRAVLREYTLKYNKGNFWAKGDSHAVAYSEDLTEGENYTVRYFFLEGEDANYTGMSKFYKDYLKQGNLIKDSELADKKYAVIDLVGAVSIEKYVVGIKMPVVTALTTYNEVCEIVKELKSQGVENLIINYIGALDGGLNNKIYTAVSPESVLGSKKEFKEMVSYLESEGVLLFLEANPVDLYNDGNGFTGNGDSVKTFFDDYAFQYLYELDTNKNIASSRWRLLRPRLASEVAKDFAESAKKWEVEQISLARIGEYLYSDYVEDNNSISKKSVLKLWHETLTDVSENSKYLMLHGGNAYCTPYADVITNVSDCFSDYDLQDRSIPFYQMTFQDDILLTADGLNTTVDYEYAFLKTLETGTSLKFNLIYGDVSNLVGTEYNTMVSYSYEYWKSAVVEKYAELQQVAAQFAGKEIVGHEQLEEDVAMTVYESGALIVNYGTEAYTYNGQQVAPRSYLVLAGGAK